MRYSVHRSWVGPCPNKLIAVRAHHPILMDLVSGEGFKELISDKLTDFLDLTLLPKHAPLLLFIQELHPRGSDTSTPGIEPLG